MSKLIGLGSKDHRQIKRRAAKEKAAELLRTTDAWIRANTPLKLDGSKTNGRIKADVERGGRRARLARLARGGHPRDPG